MKIKGSSELYAVMGSPVRHTLSPPMHNAAFEALNLPGVYVPVEIDPEDLPAAFTSMKAMGFKGANVTVPLKEIACQCMDRLDATAKLYGSVNTVVFKPEGLHGHSTDGYGFLMGFREAFKDVSLQGMNVLILGAGGAGRVVALACAEAGTHSIVISNRTVARAEKVADELKALNRPIQVETVSSAEDRIEAARQADVVIQSTSLGLHPEDPLALEPEAFRRGLYLYDLVYSSTETRLVEEARKAGVRAASGLGMLLHQGVRSFEIWTGQVPPVDVMRKALKEALKCSN